MNKEQQRVINEYRTKELLFGKPCHYMRERDSHRVCFYTECGCPFDDGNPIVECAMYRAIIENHKALNISDEVDE